MPKEAPQERYTAVGVFEMPKEAPQERYLLRGICCAVDRVC
jgi:hypothetical protein